MHGAPRRRIVLRTVGLVRVRDAAPGAPDIELEIELDTADLTVAELIRGRVTSELVRHAADPGYRPLVEQSPEELQLNGPRPSLATPDLERAVGRALSAFEAQRFLLLVDGHQLTSADEVVRLTPASDVTFLRLLPLRGG
jgi:hypothetical protein